MFILYLSLSFIFSLLFIIFISLYFAEFSSSNPKIDKVNCLSYFLTLTSSVKFNILILFSQDSIIFSTEQEAYLG